MFFIGPSVNIFVYLLVSAFFVICFYSQTEIRLPEAVPGQERIIEYRIGKNDIYYCQDIEDEETAFSSGSPYLKITDDRSKTKQYVYFANYDNPNLVLQALRAPPFIYFS